MMVLALICDINILIIITNDLIIKINHRYVSINYSYLHMYTGTYTMCGLWMNQTVDRGK
jgi:hypothetical protein